MTNAKHSVASGSARSTLPRFVLPLALLSFPASATPFSVTNSADDTNPGSLRWALTQAQSPVGIPHTITFNSANSIQVDSPLPAIIQPLTIDGTAQTTSGTYFMLVSVLGVNRIPVVPVKVPGIGIRKGTGTNPIGLKVETSNVTIRGIGVSGFGLDASAVTLSEAHGNIVVGHPTNVISNVLITQNVIGSGDNGNPPMVASPGIHIFGTDASPPTGTIDTNYIAYNGGAGIRIANAGKWTIARNQIRSNGLLAGAGADGISLHSYPSYVHTAPHDIFENTIFLNFDCAIDSWQTAGGTTVRDNTFFANGSDGNAPFPNGTYAMRFFSDGFPRNANNRVERNLLNGGTIAGIAVAQAADAEITNNTGNGIDLIPSGSTSASLSLSRYVNDTGDTDVGGNDLLNSPIVEGAAIEGNELVLSGYARANAKVEFYWTNNHALPRGEKWLAELVEGSLADTNNTAGTYSGVINGFDQGTDAANRYSFRVPLPLGMTTLSKITALTQITGKTSEFSAVAPVTLATDLAVDLSATPNPVRLGNAFSYFVSVNNKGPNDATNVSAQMTVPTGVNMTGATVGWTCTQASTNISCTRAMLAKGLTSVLEIMATAASLGSYSPSVTVSNDLPELTPADNTKSLAQVVAAQVADLRVTNLFVNPDPILVSSTVSYTLAMDNLGPDAAQGVTATFALPSGSTYLSFSGINWSCAAIGAAVNCTLANPIATSGLATLAVYTIAPAAAGTYTLNASVGSATADANPANNSVLLSLVVGSNGQDASVTIPDAGVVAPDGGVVSIPDAGVPAESGVDGSVANDASVPNDATIPNPAHDAGTEDPPPPDSCGVRASSRLSRASFALPAILFALTAIASRRRRRDLRN